MRISLLSLAAIAALLLPAPVTAQVATTMCVDGTPSATSGRGACSGHGGVDKARTKAAKKAVKAEAKEVVKSAKASGTMVQCGDGTMSNPGRGACSRHKGVRISQVPSAVTPAAPVTPARPTTTSTPATMPSTARRPVPATRATPAATPATATRATPASPSSNRREDNDPTGALAQCKDGMYSHSANRRGACSRHGGVAKWM